MKRFFLPLLAIFTICLGWSCENRRTPETTFPETNETPDSLASQIMTTPADGTRVTPDLASDTNKITTGKPPVPVFASDSNFVALALSSGYLEIRLGELAQTKATSETVKNFGRQMVSEHSQINADLKELALAKHWAPTQFLRASDRETYKWLSDRNSRQFEQDYPARLILEHEKTIAMFEQANRRTEDAALRAFTSKTLPTLRKHLEMTRALQQQLKVK